MRRWTDHWRPPEVRTEIEQISFDRGHMEVALNDGRRLSVPLSWFPVLEGAEPQALAQYTITDGRTVQWDGLDEEIHLEALLRLNDVPAESERRIHIYCYRDADQGHWRAGWTANSTMWWVDATPEGAIARARAALAGADTRYDVRAMVVTVDLPEEAET